MKMKSVSRWICRNKYCNMVRMAIMDQTLKKIDHKLMLGYDSSYNLSRNIHSPIILSLRNAFLNGS